MYGDAESYPTPETLRPLPVSPYGVTKLAAEHLCEVYRRSFGVPTVSLRLFTVYGPAQRPDMAYWFWWPEYNSPSDFCFPILSKDGTPAQHLFNAGYYESAAVNNAINKGFSDPSNVKLLEQLWRQAQTVMGKEDPPWLPLGQIIDTSYLRTDVKGYVANPVYVQSYDFHALSRA